MYKLHFYFVFFFLIVCNQGFTQQFEQQFINVFNSMNENYGNAVADYDLDGNLDVFIVAYKSFNSSDKSTWSRLLKNTRGRFEDVTEEAGFNMQHSNSTNSDLKLGASWGDYDNDGYPDLLLTHQDGTQLYHNMQNGTFKDLTLSSGITSCIKCNNTSGLWWDYDNDGDLDLYLNYLDIPNRLFKNNGDGTFQEILGALNLNDPGRTWSSLPIDANHDGWTDIYVVNDFGLSKFYINNNGEYFIESTEEYGLTNRGCGMGSTIGDFNNDGVFDIYVTNIAESIINPLFKGNTNMMFENNSMLEGVENGHFGWGTHFFDADNDGDQDLYIVNGDNELHYKNVLFKNLRTEGETQFQNWSKESNANGIANGMGAEVFDYNNDGRLDILVCNTNNSPYLYKNTLATANAWIQVSLEGTTSNRNGFGAIVSASSSGKHYTRLNHGSTMLGQSIKPVHIGFGTSNKIDSLSIKWSNGSMETIYDIAKNQKIKVVELQGMVEGDNYVPGSENENQEIIDEIVNESIDDLEVTTIPNPFSNFVDFHVKSEEVSTVLLQIEIFNINGIKIDQIKQEIPEGNWIKRWNGNKNNLNLAPGIYIYKFSLNNKTKIGKLVYTP
ncbi:T9SS type A sorting domain-containing protein [Seonamhaeicola maritimus]|uniref:T9SS type A sorting domain-containing protein n=2 Tax=Seonamhaeicola maritimus TaxID=2591822 RepID=A0A5C7GK37_9FLAO|nr:T9SS type A sorting domain-containing protein [Seonamhaeicola maritimus]